VLVTDRRYDIISFNAIHPKLSANLYTLDFYRLCRERLTPDGVIAAWLPINFLSTAEFTMLIRTFRAVFPDATLWYLGPGHAILIGTLAPRVLDYARLVDRLERPEVHADLAESNLDDPDEILSLLVLDASGVAALAGDGPLNTDDRPRVEFGISFGTGEWYASLQAIYRLALREPPPLTGLTDPAARARLERFVQARRHWLYGSIVQGVGVASRNAEMVRLGIDRYRKAVELAPESRNLKRLLEDKERLYGGGDSGAPASPP
jgi:spermidine synthase